MKNRSLQRWKKRTVVLAFTAMIITPVVADAIIRKQEMKEPLKKKRGEMGWIDDEKSFSPRMHG